ncbi:MULTISPECIES: hypothetical protein [Bacillus cereus group]|uniref:hypothetical protein n=1 Tax=Bacillus cereus group TaxID=86661 RepID=UPI001F5994CB|nr:MULTISPECIES: hypothetical protein [Bacillus cereus group]
MDIKDLIEKIKERRLLLQALNPEIGTKVMGWSIETSMDGLNDYYEDGSLNGGFWVEDIQRDLSIDDSNTFKPSENMKHTWMVIERMMEHYNCSFSLNSTELNNFKCEFRFGNEIVEYIDPCQCVAICVASLKVLSVLDGQQNNDKRDE